MNTDISTIVIAAAGRGTRMKELATDKSKHMIPVAGHPFLYYIVNAAHIAGFTRIIVVIGHHSAVIEAFMHTLPYPVELVYQSEQVGEKYGTAAVVEAAATAIGDQPFVFQNGDCLLPLESVQQSRVNDGLNEVFGMEHPHPERLGVIEADEQGFLIRLTAKTPDVTSNVVAIGLYTFQAEMIDAARATPISVRGEYEITDPINQLAAQHRVKVDRISSAWAHLSAPEDISEVEAFIRQYYPTTHL